MDALGNWKGWTDDTNGSTAGGSTAFTRTHNKANETTDSGSTWIDPTYDAAGNMTSGPKPGSETTASYYIFDAWNRMVGFSLNNDGDATDTNEYRYAYDGLGRRITKDKAGGSTDDEDYYYNENYQLLEVRKNNDVDPLEQYVWDVRYIDAPILRYRDAATDGTMEETLYVTFDANYNITGLFDPATGNNVERFWYTPYGKQTVLDANFTADADNTSDYSWRLGHQGLMHDSETGLIYNRARYLHATLGRFTARDPLLYLETMNLLQYELHNPLIHTDASGEGVGHHPFPKSKIEALWKSGLLTREACEYLMNTFTGGTDPRHSGGTSVDTDDGPMKHHDYTEAANEMIDNRIKANGNSPKKKIDKNTAIAMVDELWNDKGRVGQFNRGVNETVVEPGTIGKGKQIADAKMKDIEKGKNKGIKGAQLCALLSLLAIAARAANSEAAKEFAGTVDDYVTAVKNNNGWDEEAWKVAAAWQGYVGTAIDTTYLYNELCEAPRR